MTIQDAVADADRRDSVAAWHAAEAAHMAFQLVPGLRGD